MRNYILIIVILFLFSILIVLLNVRDNNRYSTMECYEDWRYFQHELSKCKTYKDSCRIQYIMNNEFYKDKDSIIHERNNLIEVIEASKDLY